MADGAVISLVDRAALSKAVARDRISFFSVLFPSCGEVNMRCLLISLLAFMGSVSTSVASPPGSSFLTTDGLNRAPAAVLHCVGNNNVAVPCGTFSQPLVVTSSAGIATAGNQVSQLTSEQSVASAAGSPSDTIYSGGAGSMIALLKGVIGTLANGITVAPVVGTPVSRSVGLASGAMVMVFPANPARHYLALQAPMSAAIWVNFVGGTAAPNGLDCVQLSAGTLYESGPFVTKGIVNVYSSVAVTLSAWEG